MAETLPRLEDLELFVTITDTGGVSSAARELGYTQPRATRMLQRLEEVLGVSLLARTARGSTLTGDGALVAEWARRIVSLSDELMGAVETLGRAGTARIVASQTIAEFCMPLWLAAIRAGSPDLDLSVEVDNSRGVIARVTAGEADLGFIENDSDLELARRRVGGDRLRLRVPADHAWAARGEISVDELAATPLVVREEGSGTREVLDHLLAGHAPVPPLIALHSNAAVRLAVVSGTGPAVLSELAWHGLGPTERPRTAEVEIVGADLEREFRAVWPLVAGPRSARAEEIAGHVARAGVSPLR